MKVHRTTRVNGYRIEEIHYKTKTSVYINNRLTEMTFEQAEEKFKKN